MSDPVGSSGSSEAFKVLFKSIEGKYEKVEIDPSICKNMGDLTELAKKALYTPDEIATREAQGKHPNIIMAGRICYDTEEISKEVMRKVDTLNLIWRL